MSIPKLLQWLAGGFAEVNPVQTSAGTSSAGAIPALNASGLIDPSMLGSGGSTTLPSIAAPGAPTLAVNGTTGSTTYSYALSAVDQWGAETDLGPVATVTTGGSTLSPTYGSPGISYGYPTTATTGGTLAAATYYYKVTALNANGESTPSAEVSIATTGATSTVSLEWGGFPGATSYNVYRGTAAGAENVYFNSPLPNFTDTGAAGTAGTPPATDATGSSITITAPTDASAASLYIYRTAGGPDQGRLAIVASGGVITDNGLHAMVPAPSANETGGIAATLSGLDAQYGSYLLDIVRTVPETISYTSAGAFPYPATGLVRVPANTLQVGSVIDIEWRMTVTTSSSGQNLDFWAGVNFAGNYHPELWDYGGAIGGPINGSGSNPFLVTARVVIASTGSSGTYYAKVGYAFPFLAFGYVFGTAKAINTTQDNVFGMGLNWTGGTPAGNSVTLNYLTAKVKR